MHGWLRRPNGEGRLGVDLLNQHCQIVRQQQAPRVRGGSEWRYVALECKPDMPETAARVWFRVKGQADLDDAGLAFAPASFMGNKALEADNRGRIPFWSEEKVDTLFPGKRAGEFRTDTNVTRRGKSVRW